MSGAAKRGLLAAPNRFEKFQALARREARCVEQPHPYGRAHLPDPIHATMARFAGQTCWDDAEECVMVAAAGELPDSFLAVGPEPFPEPSTPKREVTVPTLSGGSLVALAALKLKLALQVVDLGRVAARVVVGAAVEIGVEKRADESERATAAAAAFAHPTRPNSRARRRAAAAGSVAG